MSSPPPAALALALSLSLLLASCSSSGRYAPELEDRSILPVVAHNQDGELTNLREATGGPWAVIFFYPKANTPG